MMYWGDGMGGWAYVLMSVSMVLFWVLVVGGIVLLVRFLGSDRRAPAPPPDATDPRRVLATRFARGDINEDDYRQRLEVLGDN